MNTKDFFVKKPVMKNVVKNKNCFFETSNELFKQKKLLSKGVCGVMIGYEKNKQFMPSQHFLENNKKLLKNIIVIKPGFEFLFTCGRDVFEKSIIRKKGYGRFVVMNKNGEVLGICEKKGSVYKNLANIGSYLQEDKLKKIIF